MQAAFVSCNRHMSYRISKLKGWKEGELRDVIYQSSHAAALIDNQHLKSSAPLPYSVKMEHQKSHDVAVDKLLLHFKKNILVKIEHQLFHNPEKISLLICHII